MADPAAFDLHASQQTHFLNFNVYAGGQAEMEYLRHIGVLDDKFNPVGAQSLNLTQYLNQADAAKLKSGFADYSVRAADSAESGAAISASARMFIDDAPPVESAEVASTLDAKAPLTALTVTALGNNAGGAPSFDVSWNAIDDASGIKSVTVYVAEAGGDFRIWQRQLAPGPNNTGQAIFTGVSGKHYEFLAVATDNAGNREAASVANAVLPDDGTRPCSMRWASTKPSRRVPQFLRLPQADKRSLAEITGLVVRV